MNAFNFSGDQIIAIGLFAGMCLVVVLCWRTLNETRSLLTLIDERIAENRRLLAEIEEANRDDYSEFTRLMEAQNV